MPNGRRARLTEIPIVDSKRDYLDSVLVLSLCSQYRDEVVRGPAPQSMASRQDGTPDPHWLDVSMTPYIYRRLGRIADRLEVSRALLIRYAVARTILSGPRVIPTSVGGAHQPVPVAPQILGALTYLSRISRHAGDDRRQRTASGVAAGGLIYELRRWERGIARGLEGDEYRAFALRWDHSRPARTPHLVE